MLVGIVNVGVLGCQKGIVNFYLVSSKMTRLKPSPNLGTYRTKAICIHHPLRVIESKEDFLAFGPFQTLL